MININLKALVSRESQTGTIWLEIKSLKSQKLYLIRGQEVVIIQEAEASKEAALVVKYHLININRKNRMKIKESNHGHKLTKEAGCSMRPNKKLKLT
jgi:hypothetical protein